MNGSTSTSSLSPKSGGNVETMDGPKPSDVYPRDSRIIPELPHISDNIIPLSTVLKYYTQEAYKQLTTAIENLSMTHETSSDLNRKKKLLQLIMSLRQEFVKIYVLVKWASNAKDVSKLIDVLNWLRSQEFFFDQASLGMNDLNRYSGAKLPNPDLVTSLEVFLLKRPQLPSYNYIEIPPVSAEKTLEILQNLNLVLTARMALMDDLPEEFVHNYVVENGRVYLTVENEFEVEVSVANDIIVESKESYHKSPFFFVDFRFLFGINPDSFLISHDDLTTKLPESSFKKLENTANLILFNQGFSGLFDLLHKYSIAFKIYLIAKQLKEVCSNSKWRNNVQFKYLRSKSLIVINYWSGHYLYRSWRSFIEIGMDSEHNIAIRWFRNGSYDTSFDFSGLLRALNHKKGTFSRRKNLTTSEIPFFETVSNQDESDIQDLSIDLVLNTFVNKNAEILMKEVENLLNEKLSSKTDSGYLVTPHQLYIKLTPTKNAIFAINPLSGFFYFFSPSPIENTAMRKMNSPPNTKSQTGIQVTEMIKSVVNELIQVKLETFNKEISNKLNATSWVQNKTITLNEHEMQKPLNFLTKIQISTLKNHKESFYRRKNWPSGWFLMSYIDVRSGPFWWICRMKSLKGEWTVQWIQLVELANRKESPKLEDKEKTDEINILDSMENSSLTYSFFNGLISSSSNMILDHMLAEELQNRRMQYIRCVSEEKLNRLIEKYDIKDFKISKSGADHTSSTAYESTIILYNDSSLIPLEYSSTCLFLKTQLMNTNNVNQMKLTLSGKLRNLSENFLGSLENSILRINDKHDFFEMDDIVDLSNTCLQESNMIQDNNILDSLLSKLERFSRVIRVISLLTRHNIEIISSSFDAVKFKISEELNISISILMKDLDGGFCFSQSDNSTAEEKLIYLFINRYLESNDVIEEDLIGVIYYLREIYNILNSFAEIRKRLNESDNFLPNGLRILNFEVQIENLNFIRYVFFVNYANTGSSKKYSFDKISISSLLKTDVFRNNDKLSCKVSLKESLTSRNLKYKGLFGKIFKELDELESTNSGVFLKLNYDLLIDCNTLPLILKKVRDCLLQHFINV